MCGRFTLFINPMQLKERFNIINVEQLEIIERYNIAPSQNVMAIVHDGVGNKAGFLRWGLVPVWAKDQKIGYKMINARGETVDQKPAFKRLLKRRRCLIPADGFYEWKKTEKGKQPYRIILKSREPFSFAGLWDRWENAGEIIHSCTIITTKPNSLMSSLHDRMPVILNKEDESVWLDNSIDDTIFLKQLLNPYPSSDMEAHEVTTMVNSHKNDTIDLIKPL